MQGGERGEAGIRERAAGTFEIGGWDEAPYDEREGTRISRTLGTKTLRGEVNGESRAELLMAYGAEEGSAAYVGMERVVGSVHGRSGSLVLSHAASMEGGEGNLELLIVPGSGTGDLRGLRGTGSISVGSDGGHSCKLDYELA